ncbi:MAG: metallophosphoesterase [Spirochaetales bacterium]|nr:metallophosphoesterase [Spirochaetales bacterium]
MKYWILGLFICLAAVLLVGCKFNIGDYYPVTPINNDPVRNVPDVDVPQYSLSIVGGKVVADVDYVVNIDIGDKEEFRILNLADVQLSETDVRTNSEDYRFFLETTGRLIAQTHPDLITLTGDQTSNGDPDVVRAVGECVNSYDIPWAPVFGNHDCDHPRNSLEEQADVYQSFSNCLFLDGPAGLNRILESGQDSIGNYVVNLVKINGDEITVVRSLIFMNTGSTEKYKKSDYKGQRRYGTLWYACLNRNQIEWYNQMVKSVQPYGGGESVKTGIFVHIPIYGYIYAASAAMRIPVTIYESWLWTKGANEIPYAYSFRDEVWLPGYEGSYGVMHDEICGPPYDEGMFAAMKNSGSTDFIIAGHDHVNNFNIRYDGINFVYGLKTGKGSYSDPSMMGGTVITISPDGSASFENILDL